MRPLALINLLLFAFVAIACDSYRSAVTQKKSSCHSEESKGDPQEMSFDCCSGVPAKSKIDVASDAMLIEPLAAEAMTVYDAAQLSPVHLNSPPIMNRSPVLRL